MCDCFLVRCCISTCEMLFPAYLLCIIPYLLRHSFISSLNHSFIQSINFACCGQLLDAEMMVELAQELNAANPLFAFFEKGSETHSKLFAEYMPKLPAGFDSATNILNGKDFFGGASPSYGDFAFLVLLDNILGIDASVLSGHPALHAWYTRCMALPPVAAYMVTPHVIFAPLFLFVPLVRSFPLTSFRP